MKYRINVKTLTGNILTYRVENYTIEEDFIVFTDDKTSTIKKFHSTNCEITEEKEWEEK